MDKRVSLLVGVIVLSLAVLILMLTNNQEERLESEQASRQQNEDVDVPQLRGPIDHSTPVVPTEATVYGRVVGIDATPLHRVEVKHNGGTTRTAKDGRFSLPIMLGTQLTFAARGYAQKRLLARTPSLGDVHLKGSCTMYVRVSSGVSFTPNCPVSWRICPTPENATLAHGLGVGKAASLPVPIWEDAGTTDSQGLCVVHGVPCGVPVVFRARRGPESGQVGLVVPNGTARNEVEVSLEASYEVRGTAKFKDGAPATSVRFMNLRDGPAFRAASEATVDRSGEYRVLLPRGRYLTAVVAKEYRLPIRGPKLQVPESDRLDFNLPQVWRANLLVRTQDGDRVPIFFAFQHSWPGEAERSLPVSRFRQGKDGSLQLAYPAPRPPTITVVLAPGYAPSWTRMKGARSRVEDVQVTLKKGAEIKGIVKGMPEGGTVTLHALSGPADTWKGDGAPEVGRATIQSGGRFHLLPLFPGKHELRISGASVQEFHVPRIGTTHVQIDFRPGRIVVEDVRVSEAIEAQRVAEPAVAVRSLGERLIAQVETDHARAFFDSLPPGTYLVGSPNDLAIALKGQNSGAQRVEVTPGSDSNVKLKPSVAHRINLVVRPANRRFLVAVASLGVQTVFPQLNWEVVPSNGRLELRVPAGPYLVLIARPTIDYAPPSWGVQVLHAGRYESRKQRTLDLDIEESCTLRVETTAPNLMKCTVTLAKFELSWGVVRPFKPSATFSGLSPGAYRVRAEGIDPSTLDPILIERDITLLPGGNEVLLKP